MEDTRQFVDDHPADSIPPNQTAPSGRQLLKTADKRNGLNFLCYFGKLLYNSILPSKPIYGINLELKVLSGNKVLKVILNW